MRWTSLVALSSTVIACGGAAGSSLLGDGGGPDGGAADATSDTQGGDTGDCNIAACATVPSGFTVVGLSMSTCPGGWTSTDVVSAPTAGAGACTCACNVTGQPDCTTGTLNRYLDDDTTPTCNETATQLMATGGCQNVNGDIQFDHAHYQVDPPAATGGTCEYDAQTDPTKVTSTAGHMCAPPSSCPGAICGSGNVCVSQSGDVACPSGFPAKTLVGTSATANCGACGTASCGVTGTCTGTLAFYLYTDTTCSGTPVDFTANGSCVADPATDPTDYYQYFQYTGTVASATCAGPVPVSTGTATLTDPTTVCCQH
jgi:hypothetical protein